MLKTTRHIRLCFWVILAFVGYSCNDYFGNKTDLDFIEVPITDTREVAFVPIQPVWDQFIRPTEIMVGYDELIYIVDEATEEIISLDKAGKELGRLNVRGVKSVTQTRELELLAVGTQLREIAGNTYELACIYIINLQATGLYGLRYAQIRDEIVHPFYYKSTFSATDAEVTFEKISALGFTDDDLKHGFYVTRNGPNNNPSKIGGPDDAVLFFFDTTFVSPISVTSSSGEFFTDFFKKPSGITTLAKPPQITASFSREFLYTSLDPDGIIKSQYIQVIETEFGISFTPKEIIPDTSLASDYLTRPYKFKDPVSVTIAGDETGYIFVTDIESDSVYQFSNDGLEGVAPPAGSAETKFIPVSFGGTGIGIDQFNDPMSVFYDDKILYVADAGNHRILRFKLTIDFE